MTTLTNLQQQAVNQLINVYNAGHKEVQFKAPTGSGKTLMATSFVSNLINNNQGQKFIFIIATLSNADLPLQFENKIAQYKQHLPCSDFEVEHVKSPSDKSKAKDYVPKIEIVKNKVYIFGKATFGKGRTYTEQKIIDDFILECVQQDYNIIYIRDEAHIGTKATKTEVENFEKLLKKHACFTLQMTATFNNKTTAPRVELKEVDLKDQIKNEDKWLIKCKLQSIQNETIEDEGLIDEAITAFKKIQEEYKKLDCVIKPAMLIQVDSEPADAEKKEKFNQTLNLLKQKLNDSNFSWVQCFDKGEIYSNVDNSKFTLKKISKNDDTTDCIIFKIGPATGWDIPRACMLLQLRNVCSASLNIQTIGRIKRNPYPNLKKNEITDKYYIFTNNPKECNKDYKVCEMKVKENFQQEQFAVIKMQKDAKNAEIKENLLSEKTKEFIECNKDHINHKINSVFKDKDNQFISLDKKTVIKNPIMLLKYIKLKEQNLNDYQKQVFNEIKEYCRTEMQNTKWQSIFIILCDYFMSDINNIMQQCFDVNINYKINFEPINPYIYHQIFELANNNTIDISKSNRYLFEITENQQPLDSLPETTFANQLSADLERLKDNIKVWAKNPNTSNIYGEYLDEFNNTRKSYFDFVLKFNNENYLYIEVKSNDDINSSKTALLKKAYSQYFNNTNSSQQSQTNLNLNTSPEPKIIICVATVINKNEINYNYFYDKNLVTIDTNQANFVSILNLLK